MAWSDSGKTWLLACLYSPEKALHGPIQAKVDLLQQLAVDPVQFWVVVPAFGQRLLGGIDPRPALAPVA